VDIDVAADGIAAALDAFQGASGIGYVDHAEGTISVVGADRTMIPEIIALLVHAGVQIYRVAPREPSLEDVYFALHGDTEGEG
jgi:ABC-2 type transport system ATP-binding protein